MSVKFCWIFLPLLFFSLLSLVKPTLALATAYYVDATGGLDGNDGLTTSSAWQTITKVNNTTLSSGDYVYFKRGETWTLTQSNDRLVGVSGVTYGAYGSGNKPIINGNNVSDGFIAQNTSNLTLENLEFRNGYDSNAQFINTSGSTVTNVDMSGAGNDNLIFITNNTNVTVTGGVYRDPVRRLAGTLVTNIELTDGGSNFTIDGVELYGAESAGITIHNHSASDPQGRTDMPTNVTLNNIYSHDNTGHGLNIMTQDESAASTITVQNSRFLNNDNGVRIYKTASSSYYPHGNITIDKSTSGNNTNYGYYVEADDVTIQRSVFYGTTQQGRVLNSKNMLFYNNTVYLSPSSALWLLYIMGGTRVDGVTVRNNVFYMATNSGQMVGTALNSTTNVTFDYNEYYFQSYAGNARWQWNGTAYTWANWLTNSAQDTNSLGPSSNPLFVDTSSNDFHLQSTSPAVDAGVDVGLTTDKDGNTVPQRDGVDIGAYEYVFPVIPLSAAGVQGCGDVVPTRAPVLESAIPASTSVLLKFTDSSQNVSNYVLEYGTTSGVYKWGSPNIGSRETTSFLVSGLSPGKRYYFRIRNANGCVAGQASNELSAVTTGASTTGGLNIPSSNLEPVGQPVEPEEIQAEGYTLNVKVSDKEGKPVKGAKVTIHSKVQTAVTDEEGIAKFTGVEGGDHKVEIAYAGYEGEEAINLSGNVKEFNLSVTVEPKGFSKVSLITIGVLGAVIIILLIKNYKLKRRLN